MLDSQVYKLNHYGLSCSLWISPFLEEGNDSFKYIKYYFLIEFFSLKIPAGPVTDTGNEIAEGVRGQSFSRL